MTCCRERLTGVHLHLFLLLIYCVCLMPGSKPNFLQHNFFFLSNLLYFPTSVYLPNIDRGDWSHISLSLTHTQTVRCICRSYAALCLCRQEKKRRRRRSTFASPSQSKTRILSRKLKHGHESQFQAKGGQWIIKNGSASFINALITMSVLLPHEQHAEREEETCTKVLYPSILFVLLLPPSAPGRGLVTFMMPETGSSSLWTQSYISCRWEQISRIRFARLQCSNIWILLHYVMLRSRMSFKRDLADCTQKNDIKERNVQKRKHAERSLIFS